MEPIFKAKRISKMFATVLIPTTRVDNLVKSIEKLARKVRKAQTFADTIPSATILEPCPVVVNADNNFISIYHGQNIKHNHHIAEYHWVTVQYSQPKQQGWRIIGTVDWNDDIAIPNSVPGENVPQQYWNIEPGTCEHCNINRKRKAVVIIQHNDGKTMAVGKSCLKDYLGHHEATTLLQLYSSIETITNSLNDNGEAITPMFDTMTAIAATVMIVEKYGYVKASSDDWGTAPTYDEVMTWMYPHHPVHHQFKESHPLNDGHYNKAHAIASYFASDSFEVNNTYTHTLKTIMGLKAVTAKRMGILCSSVVVYDRIMGEVIKAKTPCLNAHVGYVKQRLRSLNVTVTDIRYSENRFGTVTIVNMVDTDGHCFAWFATNNPKVDSGDNLVIDGTVKNHNEYKGTKQTVLSRVKMF